MIIGKLKDLSRYKGLSKNLDTAIDYILNVDLLSLDEGKHNIDGDNVFLNRFSLTGSTEKDCFFEGHRDYLDIHMVISGQELLGYADKSDLTQVTEYDSINDFIKYEGDVTTYCKAIPGSFIITFPEDIHMPKIAVNNEIIEKAVCKVLV